MYLLWNTFTVRHWLRHPAWGTRQACEAREGVSVGYYFFTGGKCYIVLYRWPAMYPKWKQLLGSVEISRRPKPIFPWYNFFICCVVYRLWSVYCLPLFAKFAVLIFHIFRHLLLSIYYFTSLFSYDLLLVYFYHSTLSRSPQALYYLRRLSYSHISAIPAPVSILGRLPLTVSDSVKS